MFNCLYHQKDFSKTFLFLQNISFEKFLVLCHYPERQNLFSKIYLRTFLGQFVLVTLHFFLFYLVREGARGAPYDERSPSTVVDQSTGESHFESLLMRVYFVKNWEQEIRPKCISFAFHRHLSKDFFSKKKVVWRTQRTLVQKLELHFQSEFHFGSIHCAFADRPEQQLYQRESLTELENISPLSNSGLPSLSPHYGVMTVSVSRPTSNWVFVLLRCVLRCADIYVICFIDSKY